jgi:ribosomal protein S18 acetylase RimI-like enzyme
MPLLHELTRPVDQAVRRQSEPDTPLAGSSVKALPASRFSWDELVNAYNQTRIDYIVPMPMNVSRLREYVRDYDVDLTRSVVAVEANQILGLAMLGARPGRAWVTRLGVLPGRRQRGIGQLLMDQLLAQAQRLKASCVMLEVIKGNEPAYQLFRKLGFQDTRELLVLRRPPGPPTWRNGSSGPRGYAVEIVDSQQAVELVGRCCSQPSWLNEAPSLANAGHIAGLRVELADGGRGWLVYHHTVFQLTHLVLQAEAGDPQAVGQALLHALYTRHPAHDTIAENVAVDDPLLLALQELHYLEAFRRIEMRLNLADASATTRF